MKSMRHEKILQILQKENIETQEELAERLRANGIDATQATISRDIKELRLQKTLTENGEYRYSAPKRSFEPELDTRLRTIFKESVVSVDFAKNIVVLRTLPGLASAACSAVDAMHLDSIVGSLAGDDTGIIIVRDENLAEEFCMKISELMR
jgi:transcriptional regulator of arginine metabolism